MNLLVLKPTKHNGRRYKPGQDILGVDEVQAKRLIMLGAAEELGDCNPVINKSDKENDSALTRQDDRVLGSGDDSGDDLGAPGEFLSDDEVFKLIWDNFKHDVLKEDAASELGLEFAGNISKTDLINLIIEEEKEDHFLNQIEE